MQQQLFPIDEVIRALSWNQPYASLMLHGKIETRSRPTKVRGKVLISACKREYTVDQIRSISGEDQYYRIYEALKVTHPNERPLGCAIAVADLVDCRPMVPTDEDSCFVAYRPGLWCWVFANVQAIEPFLYKGSQGWSFVTDEIKKKIRVL